jgi:hypothetical protein
MVIDPIDCIINSIREQSRKLHVTELEANVRDIKVNVDGSTINVPTVQISPTRDIGISTRALDQKQAQIDADFKTFQNNFKGALNELEIHLTSSSNEMRTKLQVYVDELQKFLVLAGGHDTTYMITAQKKLITIRLIAFIVAMIKAKSKGSKFCKPGEKPAPAALDNFFNNFLSPNSPFSISVDAAGNLIVDEKLPQNQLGTAKNIDVADVLTKPRNLIDFGPVKTVFKCPVATTVDDVDRVNTWMLQLDKI